MGGEGRGGGNERGMDEEGNLEGGVIGKEGGGIG